MQAVIALLYGFLGTQEVRDLGLYRGDVAGAKTQAQMEVSYVRYGVDGIYQQSGPHFYSLCNLYFHSYRYQPTTISYP